MQVVKSHTYLKSLERIPTKQKDKIEAEVDRLETDLSGVEKIQGTQHQARLDVGDYRVFLYSEKKGTLRILLVEKVVRRTTTTYKKRK